MLFVRPHMKRRSLPTNRRLRIVSPVLFGLERLFAFFSLLSLADWLFDTRESFHLATSAVQRVRITVRRGRQIDFYMLAWIVVEVLCAVAVVNGSYSIVARVVVLYRVFEILQAQFNINLFAPLRHPSKSPRVSSTTRMVTHSLLNYLEVALCFGVVYATAGDQLLKERTFWFDPFFFSAMSQLTASYGDLVPTGWVRPVATFQGLAGFALAVLVIARLAGLLPKLEDVTRINKK